MRHYYTYRITCNHPDSIEKYYYGYRSSKCLPKEDNYWSSSKYVKRAIKEYGKKWFIKKIIKVFQNKDDALDHEIKLHERFRVPTNPLFFNRYSQGRCGKIQFGDFLRNKTYEEIHGKVKAAQLKKIRSDVFKKIDKSGEKNPMFGKKHSIESLNKMSLNSRKPNGSFWITNGRENKKIKNEHEIPVDWKRGRTLPKEHLKNLELGRKSKKIETT